MWPSRTAAMALSASALYLHEPLVAQARLDDGAGPLAHRDDHRVILHLDQQPGGFEVLDNALARLKPVQPLVSSPEPRGPSSLSPVASAGRSTRAVLSSTVICASPRRWPMAKSFASCAGVTFTAPSAELRVRPVVSHYRNVRARSAAASAWCRRRSCSARPQD